MLRNRLVSTVFLLFSSLLAFAQAPVSLTNLRCENLTDSVAIETTAPRLSWSLTGVERGKPNNFSYNFSTIKSPQGHSLCTRVALSQLRFFYP
ncbi:MAG: hypothetical protein H7Z72_04280 [Bacteroidetes bacterium]|nr:hypothetical protein [Fibrella sp.]